MKNGTADVQHHHSEFFHYELLPQVYNTADKMLAKRDEIIEQMKADDDYFEKVVEEGLVYSSFAFDVVGILFDDPEASALSILTASTPKDVLHAVMEDIYSVYSGYLHLTECIAVIAEAHGLLPEVPYDDRGMFDYKEYLRRLEAKSDGGETVPGPSDIVDKVSALAFT